MSRFPRRLRRLTACIGALLVVAGLAIGCGGSSDDEVSVAEGAKDSTVIDRDDGSDEKAPVDRASGPGGVDAGQSRPQAGEGGDEQAATRTSRSANGDRERGDKPQRSQTQKNPVRSESGKVEGAEVREAASSCLQHFSRATCARMAKPEGVESERIDDPEDCLKVMSRGECEALFAAQQAARERDESVNVDECLANPTPRCEEVLRPVFEAQSAASSEAGQ